MVTNKSPPGVDPLHSLPPTAAAPQALATSPPSKRDLTSWWRQFKRNTRKEEPKGMWSRGGWVVECDRVNRY